MRVESTESWAWRGASIWGWLGDAAGAAASNLWNGKKLVVLHSRQWRQAWSVDQVIRLRELA